MDSLDKLEEAINQLPLSFKAHFVPLVNEVQKDFQDYKNKSIVWGVGDFRSRAQDIYGKVWKDYFDENLFEEALLKMIHQHNATIGINWDVIDIYLEQCKK